MKIDELEANSKVEELTAKIISLEEAGKTGSGLSFQEGVLEDESGQVKFTFWGDYVGIFEKDDVVKMSTGWCKEFEGSKQVSTGKFGKVIKVTD